MKRFFKSTRNQSLLGGILVILLCAAVGYAVTVPNTFTANTPAVATEVNENFTALETAIDNLEAKVDNLLPSRNGKLGYARVNPNGTVNSSFSSTGGGFTASSSGTGLYTITFAGMGDGVNDDYVLQVSPESSPIFNCSLVPGPAAVDVTGNVLCWNVIGNAAQDTPFNVLFIW